MGRVAKQARTVARRVRDEQGLGAAEPVRDLLGLVEARGVAVAILETLGEDVAGAYFARGGDPVILLNGADAPQRLRFTLAHELAHHEFRDSNREDTRAGLAQPRHWI